MATASRICWSSSTTRIFMWHHHGFAPFRQLIYIHETTTELFSSSSPLLVSSGTYQQWVRPIGRKVIAGSIQIGIGPWYGNREHRTPICSLRRPDLAAVELDDRPC